MFRNKKLILQMYVLRNVLQMWYMVCRGFVVVDNIGLYVDDVDDVFFC